MGFQKFTESSKRFAAFGSVSPNGIIAFSQGARVRFDLKEGDFAVLYYDPIERMIGVEITKDRDAEGACPVLLLQYGAVVRAKAFMDFFKLDLNGVIRMLLKSDSESGMIIFDLKSGKMRAKGKATGNVSNSISQSALENPEGDHAETEFP